MVDRLKSTFDGALVGTLSGILVEIILSFLGGSPVRSHQDIVLTGLVAGAIVGWVYVDVIVKLGFVGGLLSGISAIAMIAFGTIPFALASANVIGQPIMLTIDSVTTSGMVWLLVSGFMGLLYQKLSLLLIPLQHVHPQRLLVQQIRIEK